MHGNLTLLHSEEQEGVEVVPAYLASSTGSDVTYVAVSDAMVALYSHSNIWYRIHSPRPLGTSMFISHFPVCPTHGIKLIRLNVISKI